MTIKEFSKLCKCSTQTLRYYDSINLLKPASVDKYTGYRYYEEEQALVFIKIKNLQDASFSIDEIKELLSKDEEAIYHAFEEKITEQEEKLNRIKKIQMSYRKEYMQMKETIAEIKNQIAKDAKEYDPVREFGISKEYYDKLISSVNDCLDASLDKLSMLGFEMGNAEKACVEAPENMNGNVDVYFDEVTQKYVAKPVSVHEDGQYKLVFEAHDWMYTKDALAGIPEIEGEYALVFAQKKERISNFAFNNVVLGIVMDKNSANQKTVTCTSIQSEDEKNHFWLYKHI